MAIKGLSAQEMKLASELEFKKVLLYTKRHQTPF